MIWTRRVDEDLKWVTFLFDEVQLLYYSVWAPLCRRWDLLPSCSAWDQPPLTCPATPRYRGCPHPNSHPADLPSPTGWFNFSLTSWFNKGLLFGAHYARLLLVPKHKGIYLLINNNDPTITSTGAKISGFNNTTGCSLYHNKNALLVNVLVMLDSRLVLILT